MIMARKRSKSIGRKRARRRRYIRLQSQAFVFPRRIAVSLALIFGVAMAYITLDNTNKRLGRQIKKLEAKKDTTRNKALNELFRWQNMTSPEKMDATLARYGLNMKFPESHQILKVDNLDYLLKRGVYGEDHIELVRRELEK
jgi:predicted membrane-bound mannosyltransferase